MLKKFNELCESITDKKIEKIIYLAGVVIDNSKLLELVDPKYPNIYCEHMTIQFGNIFELPSFIGTKFDFLVGKIFKDENGIAITGIPENETILNLMFENKQRAHITICTAENIKPVYSNTLITNTKGKKLNNLMIKMRVGAYCVFTDGSKGWVYSK